MSEFCKVVNMLMNFKQINVVADYSDYKLFKAWTGKII